MGGGPSVTGRVQWQVFCPGALVTREQPTHSGSYHHGPQNTPGREHSLTQGWERLSSTLLGAVASARTTVLLQSCSRHTCVPLPVLADGDSQSPWRRDGGRTAPTLAPRWHLCSLLPGLQSRRPPVRNRSARSNKEKLSVSTAAATSEKSG